MKLASCAALIAAVVVCSAVSDAAATVPRVTLTSAPLVSLPGTVDSNSPVMWDLDGGQQRLFVLTSHSGVASMSLGAALDRLSPATPITISPHPGYGVWMEAIVADEGGTWYGFYHNEWPASRCGRDDSAVPRIGAAR